MGTEPRTQLRPRPREPELLSASEHNFAAAGNCTLHTKHTALHGTPPHPTAHCTLQLRHNSEHVFSTFLYFSIPFEYFMEVCPAQHNHPTACCSLPYSAATAAVAAAVQRTQAGQKQRLESSKLGLPPLQNIMEEELGHIEVHPAARKPAQAVL